MNIAFIKCSIQAALLGFVTPNLRAVAIQMDSKSLKTIFYYNFEPTEDERELANLADTEFIANFPPSTEIGFEIVCLPAPLPIPQDDILVYLRYENS